MSENNLTHFDAAGNAVMVDVSGKPVTAREATARGILTMNAEAFAAVQSGTVKKGDVLGVARIAGIMAAKRTSELIPLCHPLPLTEESYFSVMREVIAELYETVELKPGVRTMLAKLQAEGARMCICSNTWAEQCRTVLTRLGIAQYFSFIVEAQGVLHKSHPEVFFECMSRLGGADPAACAVCEDAVYAAATAHKAGYYVIGIADRTSAADEPEMRRICSQFVPRWDMLDWTRV